MHNIDLINFKSSILQGLKDDELCTIYRLNIFAVENIKSSIHLTPVELLMAKNALLSREKGKINSDLAYIDEEIHRHYTLIESLIYSKTKLYEKLNILENHNKIL